MACTTAAHCSASLVDCQTSICTNSNTCGSTNLAQGTACPSGACDNAATSTCVAGTGGCPTTYLGMPGDIVVIDQFTPRAVVINNGPTQAVACRRFLYTATINNAVAAVSALTVATPAQGSLVYVGSNGPSTGTVSTYRYIYVCADLTFASCQAVDFGANSKPHRVSILDVGGGVWNYYVAANTGVVHICSNAALTTCSSVANLPHTGFSTAPALIDVQANGGKFFILGGDHSGGLLVRCDNAALTTNCVALTPTDTAGSALAQTFVDDPRKLTFANGKAYIVDSWHHEIWVWCGGWRWRWRRRRRRWRWRWRWR